MDVTIFRQELESLRRLLIRFQHDGTFCIECILITDRDRSKSAPRSFLKNPKNSFVELSSIFQCEKTPEGRRTMLENNFFPHNKYPFFLEFFSSEKVSKCRRWSFKRGTVEKTVVKSTIQHIPESIPIRVENCVYRNWKHEKLMLIFFHSIFLLEKFG